MVIFFMVVLLAHAAADVAAVACFDAGFDGDFHGRFSWVMSTADGAVMDHPPEVTKVPLPALTLVLMLMRFLFMSNLSFVWDGPPARKWNQGRCDERPLRWDEAAGA